MNTENTLTEDDGEDDIVIIETDGTEPKAEETEEAEAQEEEGDEDEDEGDARLAESQDDLDAEVLDEKRVKRQKRREAQRRAKENGERELRLLREQNQLLMQRMAAVEGRTLSQDEQHVDARLSEALNDVRRAETVIARATEAGNGDDVVTAMRIRDEAMFKAQQLQAAKQQYEQARNAPPQSDPRVASYAQQWLQANPWYDPNGGDEDSRITSAIDAGLAREGYNPASVDYWQELTRRVAARVGDDDGGSSYEAPRKSAAPKRSAPPVGNSREHAPVSTKKEVYVTPARKQAMIDAGIWDDPMARNKMLKAYQAYDRGSAR